MPPKSTKPVFNMPSRPARSGSVSSNASGGSSDSDEQTITITERLSRHRELRTLQVPVLHNSDLNEQYLEAHNWNVEAAFDHWRRDRDTMLAGNANQAASTNGHTAASGTASDDAPTSDSDSDSDESQQDSVSSVEDAEAKGQSLRGALASQHVVPSSNVEEERRTAAGLLFITAAAESSTSSAVSLSISEAILILFLAEWDWDQANKLVADINATRARLSDQFDHMRNTADEVDQDERLAIMLQVTERADWHSVQTFLASHNWDLVKAIVAWFKKGINPVRHPKDKSGTLKEGMGRRKDLQGKPLPMPSKADTTPGDEPQGLDWAEEPEEFAHGGRKKVVVRPKSTGRNKERKPGFMLDDDPAPIQKGAKKTSKFSIEYIQKGAYHQNIFKHNKFHWTGANKNNRPTFDWRNQEHVEILNNFRRQSRQRTTFVNNREPSQRFSQEELDFLYQLSQSALDELMRKNPEKKKEDLLPFTVSNPLKKTWVEAYNKKFVGKQYSVHKEPIRPRKINALMTQRHRYKKLQEDFGLKPDNFMSARKEKGEKRKRRQDDEADSDSQNDTEQEADDGDQ